MWLDRVGKGARTRSPGAGRSNRIWSISGECAGIVIKAIMLAYVNAFMYIYARIL